METKFKILYDNGNQYNNNLTQFLDSHLELISLNYFNKRQNLIKVINGGYEESISSFLYHELFRYENSSYLEQKIYLAPQVTPKPDLFFTDNLNSPINYQFCGKGITSFIEFGHHFSYARNEHVNKSLSDFIKWRRIFNQYNFTGEIVTIQYMTHLTNINHPYNGLVFHNMAQRNIKLNNINVRTQNIIDVENMFQTIGTLKKHFVIEYDNGNIQFSIHCFVNLFPSILTKTNLFNKFSSDIKKLAVVTKNNDFWSVE